MAKNTGRAIKYSFINIFDSVQEVMMRKFKPKSRGLKPFLYRGFFRCGECGCFITTETQKGHNYLRCTKRKNPCSQKYVREELITSQIQNEIKKVSLPLDWLSADSIKAYTRFALTEKFLKFNMELANDRTNEENTHLFKKVGSNFQIKDRTVFFEPRGAWKTLLDSEFGGGNALVSRRRRDPISASKNDFQFWRKGWDSNPRKLSLHTLSKRADSATLALFLGGKIAVATK